MDVFIARQPIFDRHMQIYGYELLYRQSGENFFSGIDDDQATAELIYNTFLVMGLNNLTDGAYAFINFSKDLITSDLPLLLPNHKIIIEILERQEATQATIDACKRIKSMGYLLALDDFVFSEDYAPLIEIIDIIKVEFSSVSYIDQYNLLNKYKPRVKFLAEKIETRQELKQALDMGYDFFQGYFFSKPTMVKSKEITSLNTNLFNIIAELNSPEPSYKIIADIIETDLGLSYKLLKLANAVYLGKRNLIKSIPQALSYLGINELYQWISLMLLKDMQNVENAEMIKLSLIRGRLMESLATELNINNKNSDYYFTGIFSFIDILLNKTMDEVLEGLPLPINVMQALLGEDNDQRILLNCIISWENANWNDSETQYLINLIGSKRIMELYIDSLKWAQKLNY